MNKTEYLEWLREWNASVAFERWVESRPEDSVRDILLACDKISWLCWNVGQVSPTKIAEFAKRCADRSGSKFALSYAEQALYGDEESAALAAARAAWSAGSTEAERQTQLEELHTLVKDVF